VYREGADGVIKGLRWTFNKCAGGLVAAVRWAFNTAVGHTQFFIILLLLAYIAMSGAMGGTSATARAAPIAHTLNQLTGAMGGTSATARAAPITHTLDHPTSGSARYELALRLARGRGLALALSYALAIAAAVAAAHAAIEEQERRTLEALDGLGDGGSPGKPEQHAAVKELERRAHEALNGLDGSAKRRHRRDDAPPETGPASSMLPGGGYGISSDKISFDNTLEPDRLSFAAAVAATHVLHPEGETPTSLVAVAAAVATGGEPVEPEQHAAADGQPELRAHRNLDGLDGNAYATAAAEPSGRADESLQGSANEPEQRAHGNLDRLDGNADAMAAETGVGQGESLPHGSANEPGQRAHAEPNGLEGNASVTAGTEAGIASGFSDTPPETSTEALLTMRRELDVSLPSGDTPTKPTSALKPLAPIGPRTATVSSHRLNTQVELTHVPASGECALSIAASTKEEAAAGEEPVLPERGSPAATLEEPDTRAWPGNLREICTEVDLKLELEEPALPEQPIALTMAMRGEALAQQRAHGDGEHDGLYSNTFAEAGMKAGVALGFSNEPPETSTVGGWVSPCAVSPLVVFPPGGVCRLCPLRSSDDVSMIPSPHPEPTSGCSEPDSGWQSAAARPGTTLSVPTPGRSPDHHHGCGTWPAAAEQCSKQDNQGLPTTRTGSEYEDDPYTEPEPPNLQEQLTARGEQMNALTVQLAALTAAMMAGQRASAAEVRTPSPRPSPPWTAATQPAAPAAPPAPPPPPTPAPPPPPPRRSSTTCLAQISNNSRQRGSRRRCSRPSCASTL